MSDPELEEILDNINRVYGREKVFNYLPTAPMRSKIDALHHLNIVKKLADNVSGTILELGAGVGNHLLQLCDNNICVDLDNNKHFFDLIRYRLKNEEKNTEFHFIVGDGFCENNILPFDDNSFDLVMSFDFFTFHPDLDKIFAEVQRILKPGGKFIFDVANLQSYWSLVVPNNRFNSFYYRHVSKITKHHIKRYWPSEIKSKLNKTQFKNISINSIHLRPPFSPVFFTRLCQSIDRTIGKKIHFGSRLIVKAIK